MAMPSLESLWMPFTPNRQFKAKPRLLSRAKGVYYWTPEGRQILDAVAGLWCVNAGHGRTEITQAVAAQLETMDYAPPFQMGHPPAFALANALVKIAPKGLDHVFFTNSGSESVDTALKIALAYQRARGEGTRTRLIGRERGYHGVGFGGISVGGAAGSNVWLAKATGSLLIRTEASRGWRVDEESLDVWQPKTSPPSNTEGTMRRRECKTASAIPFSERGHPEP